MTTKSTPTLLSTILPELNIIVATEEAGTNEVYPGSDTTTDIVSYKNATARVVVVMSGSGSTNAGAPAEGWASDDSYGSIEGFEGTRFDDVFYGNGADNIFIGGAGKDTIWAGDGLDTLSYATATSGIRLDNAHGEIGIGDALGDSVYGVENFVGSAFNDTITGNSYDNSIEGGNGDDRLDGYSGADTFNGGEGSDWVYYDYSTSGVTVSLKDNTLTGTSGATGGDAEGDRYVSIENIFGSSRSDTLTGDDNANIINGYYAADTMRGEGGNDIYYVDAANDGTVDTVIETDATEAGGIDLVYTAVDYTLTDNVENLTAIPGENAVRLNGNTLNNIIIGNGLNNIINGGAGDDDMRGGAGNDIYYVYEAGDKVTEASGGGTADLVYTTISHTLASYVEKLTASGSSAITLVGNTLANTITGNGASNTIKGGDGNDTLKGGAGYDKFVFNTALSSTSNKDKIIDWSSKYDTIQLENALFRKLLKTGTLSSTNFVVGASAKDSKDFIGYNPTTGDVWYDSNGNAAGNKVTIVNIGANKIVNNTDFVVI